MLQGNRLERFFVLACASILINAACSDGDRASTAQSPTSPSAVSAGPVQTAIRSIDFALRPFPGRADAYRFRINDLEQKYRGMGRSRVATYVDPEGSVIWVGEYLRYRAGQCSHDEAFNRIRTQINGGGVPEACGQNEQPFPPRNEALTFRQALEPVYQARGAALADTVVDAEGDVIWTMEYYRYVLSGCSNTQSIQKIMDQIDGRGVPADCGAPIPPPPPPPSALTGSYAVFGAPCIIPASGNGTCSFVGSARGGAAPYRYRWRFTNPSNIQLVQPEGESVNPAFGCGFQAGQQDGVVNVNVQVALTITDAAGTSITVNGTQVFTRPAGNCA